MYRQQSKQSAETTLTLAIMDLNWVKYFTFIATMTSFQSYNHEKKKNKLTHLANLIVRLSQQ